MSTSERANLGHVKKIIYDRHELTARIDAAEQLGCFLFSALRTLPKREDPESPYIELHLPLTDQQDWTLVIRAKAHSIESGDEEAPIEVNLWNMADSVERPEYYNDAISEITIRQSSSSQWAAVLDGADVEKPIDDYHYKEHPSDYEWPSDEIVDLTRIVVGAVKRYERQNGITAPPA